MAKKFYQVSLTATSYVSAVVTVEVDDDDTDEDGFPLDDMFIEDQAVQQALDGNVDWDYDGVDDDTIQVGSIRRRWSEV